MRWGALLAIQLIHDPVNWFPPDLSSIVQMHRPFFFVSFMRPACLTCRTFVHPITLDFFVRLSIESFLKT